MVHLTRIYTRTGDGGRTRLADLSLTSKTDPRVEAYGDVDEANSLIGVALAAGGLSEQGLSEQGLSEQGLSEQGLPADVRATLGRIQNELFDCGADLSTPLARDPRYPPLRITADYVERLEAECDGYGDPLPKLRSFVLPGGTPAAAHLHVARTVVRRAERAGWQAVERYGTAEAVDDATPGGLNPLALTYLNRLSDLLFILTRVLNGADEVLWVPGGEREREDQQADQEDR